MRTPQRLASLRLARASLTRLCLHAGYCSDVWRLRSYEEEPWQSLAIEPVAALGVNFTAEALGA